LPQKLLVILYILISNEKSVFNRYDLCFFYQAKKEIYSVKEERLILAQDEYQHLTDTLTGWKSSRTSRKFPLRRNVNKIIADCKFTKCFLTL